MASETSSILDEYKSDSSFIAFSAVKSYTSFRAAAISSS